MAIEKIRLGTNEDGSPHYLLRSDNPDAHVLFVGPYIQGMVTLADGKEVDVTPLAIEVVDEAEALAVDNAIGAYYMEHGHPLHSDPADPDFQHVPSTPAEA